jgi:hypothetical protein
MMRTLRRAAANENDAPSHAATIRSINRQYYHHKEQETPNLLLQQQKRLYYHHHYLHYPTNVSSTRVTNLTRATTLTDTNHYL